MTDPEDLFDQLDSAEAVTSDDNDSVHSSVEQSEAEHAEPITDSSSSNIPVSERSSHISPEYVARCRFCRSKFSEHSITERHEGRCKAEPVSECRYCGEEIQRKDSTEQHIEFCEAYHSATQEDSDQEPTDPEDGNKETEHFSRQFIDPQPHEFHAYLKWDCGDRENSLRSYFGFNSLQKEHDFENHGLLRTGIIRL